MEDGTIIIVDTAAPVAAAVEAKAKKLEGKFEVDNDAYNRVLSAYKILKKFATQNDGSPKFVDTSSTEAVKLIVEVPDVDLYRDRLKSFCELLSMVDSFDVSVSDDLLRIEVCIAGVWKAV